MSQRRISIVISFVLFAFLAGCGGSAAPHYTRAQIAAAGKRCGAEEEQIDKYGTRAEQKAWDSGDAFNHCLDKGRPGLAAQAKADHIASLPECDTLWKVGSRPEKSQWGMSCRFRGSNQEDEEFAPKLALCTDGKKYGVEGDTLYIGPNDLVVIPGSKNLMGEVRDGDQLIGTPGQRLVDISVQLCTGNLWDSADDLS